jgi:hypothetical protein
MIQIYENTNFIAQQSLLIFILSGLCLAIAATLMFNVFTAYRIGDVENNKKLKKKVRTQTSIALILSVAAVPIYLLSVNSVTSNLPYEGSSQYTVSDTKTGSSGDQLLIIDDGKSKVELEPDKYDKTSYKKDDKINVTIQTGDSDTKGKHYLSDTLKPASTSYEIKKLSK